jgi:nucleotide-binding universal stress UspA family protein
LADAEQARLPKDYHPMSTDVIISYDGTPNDDDALALGKRLAATGAKLALAYVRHAREFDPRREELAQHDAEARLDRGAGLLGEADIDRHVVVGASTFDGLGKLAESEGASVIVFGSDYRTAPGHAEPGNTAEHLLDGGPVAIAVAPAGLRTNLDGSIETIAVPVAGPRNDAARATAHALAEKLGASVVEPGAGDVDLIVVGSKPGAPSGRVVLGGEERSELARARSAVLVLPADSPVQL